MKKVMVVCIAALVACSQRPECTWKRSVSSSPTDFDSAVRSPQNSVSLSLVEGDGPFALLSSLQVDNCLMVLGNRQTLILTQAIAVLLEFRVSNATLKGGRTGAEALVEVRGAVVILHCSLEDFSIPLFRVFGVLQVLHSTVNRSSEATATLSAASELSLAEVAVDSHVGVFLDCDPKLEAEVTVNISTCSFRNCYSKGAESLLQLAGSRVKGSLSVVSSRFTSNSSPLLYFDVSRFVSVIVNCTFALNTGTQVAGYAQDSLLEARDCTWTDNAGVLIDMRKLNGNLTVANSTVVRQTKRGAIQVYGSGDCQMSLVHSVLSDSAIYANDSTPGAISAYYCSVGISNTSISDFSVYVAEFRQVYGLIAFRFSLLTVASLQMSRSGSTEACLIGAFSSMRIIDSTFHRSLSGQNLIVALTAGAALISNLTFVDHELQDFGRPLMGFGLPTLLAFMSVSGALTDIYIRQVNSSQLNFPFVMGSSDINVTGVDLRNVRVGTVLTADSSTVTIRDLLLEDMHVDGNVVYLLRGAKVHITNFSTSNSTVDKLSVLGLSSGCFLSVENLTFSEVAASQLIAAKNSVFVGSDFYIDHTHLSFLVQYSYGSQFVFRRLRVVQSRMGLFSIVESNVTLSDCSFREVAGSTLLFQAQVSNIAVCNTSFQSVSSLGKLGMFYEISSLSITESSFHDITAEDGEGLRVIDSFLTVTNCKFSQYSAALFQAIGSTVTIHDSSFRGGANLVQSLSSDTAYGGVLGCVSCRIVDIRRVAVVNVTAAAGVALAVRLTDATLASAVYVGSCRFTTCRAQTGGAVYVSNSVLTVDSCEFTGNSAERSGGALFVDVRTSDSNSITNCTFQVNSAYEGGAVKWKNAPANIEKCRYLGNTAYYGPDIASYGMQLSSRLTNASQVHASGSTLSITFELLDHYGSRVKTATNQYLTLLSTNVHYRGNNVSFISEGVFYFPEVTVYALPNSTQMITGQLNDTQGDFRIHAVGTVALTFRDCVAGEIRRADQCEYCYSGTVSYSPLDSNCTYCPQNAFCPGGAHLLLDSKYWRKQVNTTSLFRCPLEDKCEGGEYSGCAEGYTGLLCNQCADGYYRFRTVECESCLHVAAAWVQVLIPIVLIALFVCAVFQYSQHSKVIERFLLKTAIHHTQFLAAMSPLRISLPPAIKVCLHALAYVSSLQVSDLPLACFGLPSPEVVRALIASLLLPGLLTVFLITSYLLTREWEKRTLLLSSTALLFTPTITVHTAVPLLVCRGVGSSEEWLFLDMSYRCWTNAHKLVLFSLLIPSFILSVLAPLTAVILTAVLRPSVFDEYCAVWRSGYRCRCWDALFVVSKVACIALLTATIDQEKLSQLTYGLIVFIVTSVVNVSRVEQVHLSDRLFYLSEVSLVLASVSMGLCSYYIYSSPGSYARDYLISALFILLNAGFFAVCIVLKARQLLKSKVMESHPEVIPPHNSIVSSLQSFSS